MNYLTAKHIANELVTGLRDACQRIEIAGSVRRAKAEVKDLELVCIPLPGAPRPEFGQKPFVSWLGQALHNLEQANYLGTRIKDGEKYKQIIINTKSLGFITTELFKLDLFIVRPETWGVQFAIRTGPAEFSHKLVTRQEWGGLLPDHMKVEDGLLWDTQTRQVIPTLEEQDFFAALGLEWLEPKARS
jgi:DNA polymerase/3'-5' exonuclease PolX